MESLPNCRAARQLATVLLSMFFDFARSADIIIVDGTPGSLQAASASSLSSQA